MLAIEVEPGPSARVVPLCWRSSGNIAPCRCGSSDNGTEFTAKAPRPMGASMKTKSRCTSFTPGRPRKTATSRRQRKVPRGMAENEHWFLNLERRTPPRPSKVGGFDYNGLCAHTVRWVPDRRGRNSQTGYANVEAKSLFPHSPAWLGGGK